MESDVERELAAASGRGDRDAYARLIKAHYGRIFGICLGTLVSVHDAEDAAQDTVVRAFERIHNLRDGDQFGAWIGRIAKNLCIDYVRRRKRGKEMLAKQAAETNPATVSNNHDLEGVIRQLPAEWRTPLVMYYFDGRSAKNIAETLGISHSNVCRRLRQGRKELHKHLSGPGEKNE